MTRRRATPEQVIQRAVCEHLRTRGALGLVWWHTPNGGRRNRVEAAIFSGLGVRPGVSDFRATGGEASIASGLDQALRTLETWGVLRGRVA